MSMTAEKQLSFGCDVLISGSGVLLTLPVLHASALRVSLHSDLLCIPGYLPRMNVHNFHESDKGNRKVDFRTGVARL